MARRLRHQRLQLRGHDRRRAARTAKDEGEDRDHE
jgi:hypothetical protein